MLACHSSTTSFLGMRFLLYGDIITDGTLFTNRMKDIISWRNHLGLHSIINHRFKHFSLFYSKEDSIAFTDCRRIVFSRSMHQLLLHLDFHDAYRTRSYFISFRRIYSFTPFHYRIMLLLFHGFLQSALRRFQLEFQTHTVDSIHSRYDYLIALCIFCTTVLSEKVHHSFIIFQKRRHRRLAGRRLTLLLYSFFASIFSEVEEGDFCFFVQFLETQRPNVKALVFSLFLSVIGRKRNRIHSHAHLQRLAAILRRPGSKNSFTRIFAKRFIRLCCSSHNDIFISKFIRAFNTSFTCCAGLRISSFCIHALRADGSQPYCFFTNRARFRSSKLPWAEELFMYLDGDLKFFRRFMFYRFLVLLGFFDLRMFIDVYLGMGFDGKQFRYIQA